jgi:hypothetical protein
VESFADRLCITGEAQSGTIISPETILDCSGEGCNGGNPKTAWDYLISDGSATCTSQCFSGWILELEPLPNAIKELAILVLSGQLPTMVDRSKL